jgi:hypothetical protein
LPHSETVVLGFIQEATGKSIAAREYDLLGHAFIAEITARRAKQATQPKGGA